MVQRVPGGIAGPFQHVDATDEFAPTKDLPDKAFDRRWAETVLARTSARLRSEYEATGQGERFAALGVHLLREGQAVRLADLAEAAACTASAQLFQPIDAEDNTP